VGVDVNCDDDSETRGKFDGRVQLRTADPVIDRAVSAGPSVRRYAALWADSPSPVVLFRSSRSDPGRKEHPNTGNTYKPLQATRDELVGKETVHDGINSQNEVVQFGPNDDSPLMVHYDCRGSQDSICKRGNNCLCSKCNQKNFSAEPLSQVRQQLRQVDCGLNCGQKVNARETSRRCDAVITTELSEVGVTRDNAVTFAVSSLSESERETAAKNLVEHFSSELKRLGYQFQSGTIQANQQFSIERLAQPVTDVSKVAVVRKLQRSNPETRTETHLPPIANYNFPTNLIPRSDDCAVDDGRLFESSDINSRKSSSSKVSYALTPQSSCFETNGAKFTRPSSENDRLTRKDIMKPQIFDGKEPVNSFLAHFEVCAKFNSWSEEQKVSWLQWSLKGRAQQILWDLPSDKLASYDLIRNTLRQRFGSEHQTELYKLELRNRRRGPRESLSDVMQDVRRLMVLAYSAAPSDMWESVAMNAFLEALDDPEFAVEVRKRGPTTLDAAYRDALLLEGLMKACSRNDNDKGRRQVRATTDSTLEIRHEIDDVRRTLRDQERKQALAMREQTERLEQLLREKQITPSVPRQGEDARAINLGAAGSSHNRTLPKEKVCYQCNQPGHFKRNCPSRIPPAVENVNTAAQNNRYVTGSRSAYIVANIFGHKRFCLLDTGSETSIIPARFMSDNDLRPSVQTLNAANGTAIRVLGEADIMLNIGSLKITVPCIVSEHVDEILLGLSFLEQNDCVWDFSKRSISIKGERVRLLAHKPTNGVRRVVLQDETVLQPRCQQTILAKTVYSSLPKSAASWVTKPTELTSGVGVARTLVTDSPENVQIRVVNTNDYEVHLKKGMNLGSLEEVEAVESDSDNERALTAPSDNLADIINGVDVTVSDEDKSAFNSLLEKYRSIFSKGDHDLGCASAVKHRIDTGNSRPIRQTLRRQPAHYVQEIDRQIDEWVAQGRIEPSQSEWASNVVIVKKKDGSLRFCVDYRQLNEGTIKDSYPLPRIDDCLDCLGGATWYSTMDLRSGYHQVVMDERDKHKTTFVTRRGAYAFNVMPFGLCNAPATFQRLMDCTMKGLNFEVCLVFLDDIIVYSADIPTHLQRLELVFSRLQSANLKLKPSKCSFLKREVNFLGYKVSSKGIETDSRKIEAVLDWPTPKKLKEVRGFLGLCGYYRKFVEKFADIAAPLHALTKKNCSFLWSTECQNAFNTLKQKLTEAPILALPRDGCRYILDTDASDHGIGAVLSQIQGGEERVICYASRLYSSAEKRYCVTRKELLAAVHFLKSHRQYLLGREFLLRTDHAALQWLRRTPEPIGQQGRWLEILEEFNFTVEHRPGAKHGNADALSRRPCKQCGLNGNLDSSMVLHTIKLNAGTDLDWSSEALARAQSDDPDLGFIYKEIEGGRGKPTWSAMLPLGRNEKIYWTQWDFFVLRDHVLYRRYSQKGGRPETLQMVMPTKYRSFVMHQAHAGFGSGHMGERRTLDQVRRRAYWAGWASDVRRMLRACPECCSFQHRPNRRQGQLQKLTVGMPWERIGIDITGPHPKSRNGFTYILTLSDYFSKWADAFPIRNQEASTVAKVLAERVFPYMGTPLQIMTDRGSNFQSQLFNELLQRLGIDHVQTTAYKPSTNGQVERFHRTLNSILGKVIAENQRDWDLHIPYAVAAYRATVHEATGYSPNFLIYGREVAAPLDVVMGQPPNSASISPSVGDFVEDRLATARTAYGIVRENLRKAAERQKHYYDLRVKKANYTAGDRVWLWRPRRKTGRKFKWARCYTGPFTVIEPLGPVNYRIRRSNRTEPIIVHVDKLKPYFVETNDGPALPKMNNRKGIDSERALNEVIEDNHVETDSSSDSDSVVSSSEVVPFQRPHRQLRLPARYRN
jgi:transposase InsO family protein